ncbi:hypothetical protein PMIT1320_00906 [Prochlorococcus marinus str. MIT 1320]|nr:hypothetical protein PMIT1320_00906 [Prochlorococcus marinus str. MIT 1320]
MYCSYLHSHLIRYLSYCWSLFFGGFLVNLVFFKNCLVKDKDYFQDCGVAGNLEFFCYTCADYNYLQIHFRVINF